MLCSTGTCYFRWWPMILEVILQCLQFNSQYHHSRVRPVDLYDRVTFQDKVVWWAELQIVPAKAFLTECDHCICCMIAVPHIHTWYETHRASIVKPSLERALEERTGGSNRTWVPTSLTSIYLSISLPTSYILIPSKPCRKLAILWDTDNRTALANYYVWIWFG